mmetsp:Transcript_17346/g.29021  ORF Transcript_17346/g.29021 Transcript_17346/m.29021 type:complete len:409 (+) Transcript_17346:64-1290(+)
MHNNSNTNAPKDRLSRLINSVCQVWEEEASETEGKLVTLANRIIADNEHEKVRMQHSFKGMMNMKNSEIGALSQELRKLNFALEQEAKENMENKRKIRALTIELETLKGNGGNLSPLSACSHLIEDDVSSLPSLGSAPLVGSGVGGGAGNGPPGSSPHYSPSGEHPNLELPLSGNGNRLYDNQQPKHHHSGQQGRNPGYFAERSPPQQGASSQHQGFHGHGLPPPQQSGGEIDSMFYSQSNSHSSGPNFFPPGQHAPRTDQGWDNSRRYDNSINFGAGNNDNGNGMDGSKPRNWDTMDYSERGASSLMSMLDDKQDHNSVAESTSLSKLSLSDGPPGFDMGNRHDSPVFQATSSNMPPGFDKGDNLGEDNLMKGSSSGQEGGESTEILNSIRLQSKSSKLDASPVGSR